MCEITQRGTRMGDYVVQRVEEKLVIVGPRGVEHTPGGNPWCTGHERLAAWVCDDLNAYGPDPMASSSFVTLHGSYMDMGRTVPRENLIENIACGYTPQWDFALACLMDFEDSLLVPKGNAPALDPAMYFGPYEDPSTLREWLDQCSRRALMSMQVSGASFCSILLGFRLLASDAPFSPEWLAKGVLHCGGSVPNPLADKFDGKGDEHLVAEFLSKIRQYATFPDEYC
jgi:hypothetical protein